jgi:putative transposase
VRTKETKTDIIGYKRTPTAARNINDGNQNGVFSRDNIQVIRTPCRAPQSNGVAERFVRTVRSECLDWLLILNPRHLERVLADFADHYNGHRPHRGLALNPPHPVRLSFAPTTQWSEPRVRHRDRLGGLVHEYVLAA